MAKYLLSPSAGQDIVGISEYTLDTWGREQAGRYLSQIEERYEWLAKNPEAGKSRNEVKEGYRSFPEGRHVIFYRVREGMVEIIGVIHQSEDAESI